MDCVIKSVTLQSSQYRKTCISSSKCNGYWAAHGKRNTPAGQGYDRDLHMFEVEWTDSRFNKLNSIDSIQNLQQYCKVRYFQAT